MKFVTYHQFGGTDTLAIEERKPDEPGRGEVRVRVKAAALNPVDGKMRRGELKLLSGGKFPQRVGADFAGVIEALGEGVSEYSVGDAVFGTVSGPKVGSLAELAVVPLSSMAAKPRALSFEEAASTPVVALAALKAIEDIAKVKAGSRVAVNGCTGGVGLFALQLADNAGAHVTGVCGPDTLGLAREYGADEVINYKEGSLLTSKQRFDALLELSAKVDFSDCHDVLTDHGVFVDFVPTPGGLIGNTLANPFRGQQHKYVMTSATHELLARLAKLFDDKKLRPVPLKIFDFADVRAAYDALERGNIAGKVVVRIGE